MAIMGADGKPAQRPTGRLVYLAIPVKETATGNSGQIIIHGLTDQAADSPGTFGVYQHATTAKMSRTANAAGAAMTGSEDWEFVAATGERMELHVEYERGPAVKGANEVKFFYPQDPKKYQVFKTDQAMEDVHFLRTQSPRITGQRALARALSDIASMGGDPLVCLVSLTVPPDLADHWIRDFYKGLLSIAHSTCTALCGGDLGHSEKIYCDIALCGSVPRGKALRRDGARVGDAIYVSGPLGKPWDKPIQPRLELGRSEEHTSEPSHT